MTTGDLVKMLLDVDPSGQMELLVQHEYWAYSISGPAEKKHVEAGVTKDSGEPNCIVIETI